MLVKSVTTWVEQSGGSFRKDWNATMDVALCVLNKQVDFEHATLLQMYPITDNGKLLGITFILEIDTTFPHPLLDKSDSIPPPVEGAVTITEDEPGKVFQVEKVKLPPTGELNKYIEDLSNSIRKLPTQSAAFIAALVQDGLVKPNSLALPLLVKYVERVGVDLDRKPNPTRLSAFQEKVQGILKTFSLGEVTSLLDCLQECFNVHTKVCSDGDNCFITLWLAQSIEVHSMERTRSLS